jgi:hypothetical protein
MGAEQSTSERRFRVIGICRDGERLIFADGLDIIEAYSRRRELRGQPFLPQIVIEPDLPATVNDESK